MLVTDLQRKLGVAPTARWDAAAQAALLAHFTNRDANAVASTDLDRFAQRLGCSAKQIVAVAMVESGGAGFDTAGRPKILFERHLFHRLTQGRWSPASFSQAQGGGYKESSWEKLGAACGHDPDAAFSSASWGKFQVLGMHWAKLGYPSPYALAWTTAQSEGDHYELLIRYIETFGLKPAIRQLSANPETCRDFAKLYNGPGYRTFQYHIKLARAMQ